MAGSKDKKNRRPPGVRPHELAEAVRRDEISEGADEPVAGKGVKGKENLARRAGARAPVTRSSINKATTATAVPLKQQLPAKLPATMKRTRTTLPVKPAKPVLRTYTLTDDEGADKTKKFVKDGPKLSKQTLAIKIEPDDGPVGRTSRHQPATSNKRGTNTARRGTTGDDDDNDDDDDDDDDSEHDSDVQIVALDSQGFEMTDAEEEKMKGARKRRTAAEQPKPTTSNARIAREQSRPVAASSTAGSNKHSLRSSRTVAMAAPRQGNILPVSIAEKRKHVVSDDDDDGSFQGSDKEAEIPIKRAKYTPVPHAQPLEDEDDFTYSDSSDVANAADDDDEHDGVSAAVANVPTDYRLSDYTPQEQTTLKLAKSHLRVALYCDPYPKPAQELQLLKSVIKQANNEAGKNGGAQVSLTGDANRGTYRLLRDVICQVRGQLKAKAKKAVKQKYCVDSKGNVLSSEVIAHTMGKLLDSDAPYYTFRVFDVNDPNVIPIAPFGNSLVIDILAAQLFSKGSDNSDGITHPTVFKTIPPTLLALTFAAIKNCLEEWRSGVHATIEFGRGYATEVNELLENLIRWKDQEPAEYDRSMRRLADAMRKPKEKTPRTTTATVTKTAPLWIKAHIGVNRVPT